MKRGWLVGAAACLCASSAAVNMLGACSSSSSASDAGDAGEGGIATCGDAPYANVNARITSLTTGMPVEGATVTLDPAPCTGVQATTDSNGVASARIQLNTAVSGKVEHAGYLTERTGEQSYRGDIDAGGFVVPTVAAGALPHYSSASPDILTVLYGNQPDAGPEAGCASVAGATFSVVGHPEAVVTYYHPGVDGGLPTPDTTLTATTSLGGAEISGLAAGQTVQLQVTSPTCGTASYVSYPLTGRYYLENGVLSIAPAFLVPTP
jgi:hypothetical protein